MDENNNPIVNILLKKPAIKPKYIKMSKFFDKVKNDKKIKILNDDPLAHLKVNKNDKLNKYIKKVY